MWELGELKMHYHWSLLEISIKIHWKSLNFSLMPLNVSTKPLLFFILLTRHTSIQHCKHSRLTGSFIKIVLAELQLKYPGPGCDTTMDNMSLNFMCAIPTAKSFSSTCYFPVLKRLREKRNFLHNWRVLNSDLIQAIILQGFPKNVLYRYLISVHSVEVIAQTGSSVRPTAQWY